MADFGGGTSVGTLVVNLTMNTAPIAAAIGQVEKNTKSMADKIASNFSAAGGFIGNFGEKIGNIGKAFEKAFGDNASAAFQALGESIQKSIGLSDAQVQGLKGTVESLEGAFKMVGGAVELMTKGLGKALLTAGLLATSAIMLVGAFSNASKLSGGESLVPKPIRDAGAWVGQQFKQSASNAAEFVTETGNYLGGRPRGTRDPGSFVSSMAGFIGSGEMLSTKGAAPGSVAETVAAFDPLKDASDGLTEGMSVLEKQLGPVAEKFKRLLESLGEPGEKKADVSKRLSDAKKDAEKADKELKAKYKAQDDALNDALEAGYDADREREQSEKDLQEQRARDNKFLSDMERETFEQEKRDLNDRQERDAKTAKMEEDAAAADRQALGAGRFGDIGGPATGIGGVAANILGGTLASHNLTGKALSGAAEGSIAGPVGAIIGAILALLGETKAWGKILDMIEGLLEGILPALDAILGPIVQGLEPLFRDLAPILDVLTEVLGGIADAVMGVVGAIQGLVDKDLGAGYSFKDYTTPSGWIGMIADEIEKGNASGKEAQRKKQLGWTYLEDMQGKPGEGPDTYDRTSIGRLGIRERTGKSANGFQPVEDTTGWSDEKYAEWSKNVAPDSDEMVKFKTEWNAALDAQEREKADAAQARADAERTFLEMTGTTLASFEELQGKTLYVQDALTTLADSTKQAGWNLSAMSDAAWLAANATNDAATREVNARKASIDAINEYNYAVLNPGDYNDAREAEIKRGALTRQQEDDFARLHPELIALEKATAGAADAANKLGESLTNVAVGYKMKAAQYQATDTSGGATPAGPAGSSGGGGGGGGGGGITIVVQGADDPEETARRVQQILERDRSAQNGSPVDRGNPFS